jgi:hypothetical protein
VILGMITSGASRLPREALANYIPVQSVPDVSHMSSNSDLTCPMTLRISTSASTVRVSGRLVTGGAMRKAIPVSRRATRLCCVRRKCFRRYCFRCRIHCRLAQPMPGCIASVSPRASCALPAYWLDTMKPHVEQANMMSRSSPSAPAVSSDFPVPASFQTLSRSGLALRALISCPCYRRVCLYGQGSIGHIPPQDIVMQVIFLAPFFPRWIPAMAFQGERLVVPFGPRPYF